MGQEVMARSQQKGSSGLCTSLLTQGMLQVDEDWTRSMCVCLHSLMSLWPMSRLFLRDFVIAEDPH